MSSLLDINIWLALTFSAHPHHEKALSWFDSMPLASCAFCRMTQQGFLRLASNPNVFGSDALELSTSWKAYDTLRSDDRVGYASEPAEVETTWREFTAGDEFSTKIWNDAYLAAFAKQARLRLVTFDRGFRSYSGLSLNLLR